MNIKYKSTNFNIYIKKTRFLKIYFKGIFLKISKFSYKYLYIYIIMPNSSY